MKYLPTSVSHQTRLSHNSLRFGQSLGPNPSRYLAFLFTPPICVTALRGDGEVIAKSVKVGFLNMLEFGVTFGELL